MKIKTIMIENVTDFLKNAQLYRSFFLHEWLNQLRKKNDFFYFK